VGAVDDDGGHDSIFGGPRAAEAKGGGGVESGGGEEFPTEDVKKQVVFASFFERGFNIPAGDFFQGLLFYYKLELIHLVPNSITEVYLGTSLLTPKIGTRKRLTCGPSLVRKTPFSKKFSSRYSVKMLAVGSTPSFGRRAVSRLKEEAFGNT
jgi:hypothetical protein